ncbi:hypothetical protein [Corynebacterium sp. 22KM0430]|uniref:hypothetical protein n=1 Tax=Corynebacterium sp. 22KM0430 TaxID=2989735 RepID=UPI0029C9CC68|nr:hypothetical protein [Corynebacterium sp. 22KM0430]WPF66013.1 hypothetical protein OLX12_10760 [Corynebacterium sp. 22KM0430]
MLFTILKGLALATGLFSLGSTPFITEGSAAAPVSPVAETVAASAAEQDAAQDSEQTPADREAAAEAAVQAIEDEAGHDLVNIEFDGDSVVLRQLDTFDQQNDQEAFTKITDALSALGYTQISAVAAPVVFEQEEFQLTEEERQKVAEQTVQAIEDEAGHDLVNIEFDGDSVVLRPVESFDEVNDQDYFSEIMESLRALGYENVAAVGKPLYIEQPEFPELDPSILEAEENVDVEALVLPEVDPAFSHVIRA